MADSSFCLTPAGLVRMTQIWVDIERFVRDPGEDTPENILHLHHGFLTTIAHHVNVDIGHPPQPAFTHTSPPINTKPIKIDDIDDDAMDIDGHNSTKAQTNTAVIGVSMSLSDDMTADKLINTIQTFTVELSELTLSIRRDNKRIDGVTLQDEEINKITTFFFQETFGSKARDRIISLLAAEAHADSLTTGERAIELARRQNILEDFRYPAARVLNLWHRHRLYADFTALLETAKNEPARYREFLQTNGLTLSWGQGSATAIISYLTAALGITRTKIRHVLQISQPIHLLAETFGLGVIALIPANSCNTLHRLGICKLTAVIPLVTRALGSTAIEICNLAQAHILDHLLDGTIRPELRITNTEHPHELSLLEALSRVDLDIGEIAGPANINAYPIEHSDVEIKVEEGEDKENALDKEEY